MAVGDLGKGITIEFQGEIYTVVDYSHVFKGRGKATAQTKLKSLRTGRVVQHNFSESDNFKLVRLEEKQIKFLYRTGSDFHFMDNESSKKLLNTLLKLKAATDSTAESSINRQLDEAIELVQGSIRNGDNSSEMSNKILYLIGNIFDQLPSIVALIKLLSG